MDGRIVKSLFSLYSFYLFLLFLSLSLTTTKTSITVRHRPIDRFSLIRELSLSLSFLIDLFQTTIYTYTQSSIVDDYFE